MLTQGHLNGEKGNLIAHIYVDGSNLVALHE